MDLLNISSLTKKQVINIFNKADKLKSSESKNLLKGKTFVLFFPESSIRTRISFEKGINDLGGQTILFPPSSLDKKEELEDVIKYIENWADLVIIRHKDLSKINVISNYSNIPIINAMTNENHPCEILTDLYSISRLRCNYMDLTYTFVGPDSNILKSWIELSNLFNLKFYHVCSNEFQLVDSKYNFSTNLDNILPYSDVVLTDSIPEELNNKEYLDRYQITLNRMKHTKNNSLLNPCPPFTRGKEVTSEVIESDYFVGYIFKKNLLYVQQAIILLCLGINIE